MANAVIRMSRRKRYERISSHEYAKIKSSLKGNGPNKGRKFSLEARKHMSEGQKGKIPYNKGKCGLLYAVNNGVITKMIPRIELSTYIDNGWVRGRIKGQYRLSAKTRLRISNANKGKKKPNVSKALKGKPAWNKGKHYKQSDLVHHNRAIKRQVIETQHIIEQYLEYVQKIFMYQNEIQQLQAQQKILQDNLTLVSAEILTMAIAGIKLPTMMNIGSGDSKAAMSAFDQLIQILTIDKLDKITTTLASKPTVNSASK